MCRSLILNGYLLSAAMTVLAIFAALAARVITAQCFWQDWLRLP